MINLESIAIVVAGNFQEEEPTPQQLASLRSLVMRLDAIYSFDRIIPHRDASPTACPGEKLISALKDLWRGDYGSIWYITRYYTPVPGQPKYFRDSYEADYQVNCSGDCFNTSDNTNLHEATPFTVAACPPEMPFGTKLEIEGIGVVTCHDRGGAIKEKRIDVWAGVGVEALAALKRYPGQYLLVKQLP